MDMSIDQRKWISNIVLNIFRASLALTAYLCTTIFMDIRTDIRSLKDDVGAMKERLIVVEVKLSEKRK